ncbi:MAG: hypothetical protein KDD44_10715, partial [Bdellovibrionales bacterium]|nr:hypothetical protein [Bdellovibrionales bacterium]
MSDSSSRDNFIDQIDENKPFLENWCGMRKLGELVLPVGWRDTVAVSDGDSDGLLDFLDRPGVEASPGYRVQLVYTSRARAGAEVTTASVSPELVLHRTFKNACCEGLTFNPPEDDAPEGFRSYTLHSFALPRMIGMLRAKEVDLTPEVHLQQAQDALARDDQYLAMFHVVEARERGCPLPLCFDLEINVLSCLALREQANSYYTWFQQRCPDQSLL